MGEMKVTSTRQRAETENRSLKKKYRCALERGCRTAVNNYRKISAGPTDEKMEEAPRTEMANIRTGEGRRREQTAMARSRQRAVEGSASPR